MNERTALQTLASYVALWVFGLAIDRGDSANFIPLDSADNWLHFALGLSMVAGGLALGSSRRMEPAG